MNRRYYALLIIGVVLWYTAGCRRATSPKTVPYAEQPVQQAPITDEIRLVDISIPIGVSVYAMDGGTDDVFVTRYESKFSVDMLADFYHLDMERLGWQEHAFFQPHHEATLLFEKPYRWCIVAIKTAGRTTQVTLHIRQKQPTEITQK